MPIIRLIHSVAIVLWCFYLASAFVNNNNAFQYRTIVLWILTGALFLATFRQHRAFYDTCFAALGAAIIVLGIQRGHLRQVWLGFIIGLLTRETTVLMMGFMALAIPSTNRIYRYRWQLFWVGIIGFLGSVALMLYTGGPIGAVRYSSCYSEISSLFSAVVCLFSSSFYH